METLQVIALIIVALVILAVVIAFRKRITLTLKSWGLDLSLEAENETSKADTPAQPAATPAGVRARQLKSKRGILIEEGAAHDPGGVGIDASELEAGDDIIIGRGESGAPPKAPPPA